jgi:tetratricopeptide (TPR) repeat protein
MRATERRRVRFAVFAAALTFAALARADDDHDKAERLFREGRELVRAGRFAEAAVKFKESIDIHEVPSAVLNLADCYEKLGRYASAQRAFRRVEAIGDRDRAVEAKRRADALAPSVPIVVVQVERPAAGLVVRVDDANADPGVPLPVDSGDHKISARGTCKEPFETTIHMPPRGGPSSALATTGIALGVAGLVTAGVGAFFGMRALDQASDLESACTSYPHGCPSSDRDSIVGAYDDARSSATVANVGLVAGGVLLAAGVVLVLVSSGKSDPRPSSGRAHVWSF